MNYLVTGGGGFIGINLVKELLAQGHRVRIIDKDPKHGHVSGTAVCDIRDKGLVHAMCRGIDVIVHLAAETGVQPSIDNPRKDMSVNVEGTLNLLEAARECDVNRFIFASSGAVSGDTTPPLHEEMMTRPTSPYGASKLAGEAYCSAFYHSYGLDTVALRFSNIYGPYAWHKSNLFVEFIRASIERGSMQIFGDGFQTRDFLYVKDLVSAIIAASVTDNIGGQVFQIASGQETSIRDILQVFKTVTNLLGVGPVMFHHKDARSGEVKRSYADITKAQEILKWEPKYSLINGMTETFQWYMRKYGNE